MDLDAGDLEDLRAAVEKRLHWSYLEILSISQCYEFLAEGMSEFNVQARVREGPITKDWWTELNRDLKVIFMLDGTTSDRLDLDAIRNSRGEPIGLTTYESIVGDIPMRTSYTAVTGDRLSFKFRIYEERLWNTLNHVDQLPRPLKIKGHIDRGEL